MQHKPLGLSTNRAGPESVIAFVGGWPLGVTGLHPLDDECCFVSGSNYLIKGYSSTALSVDCITNCEPGKIIMRAISSLPCSILEAFKIVDLSLSLSPFLGVIQSIHPSISNHHAFTFPRLASGSLGYNQRVHCSKHTHKFVCEWKGCKDDRGL